jgi:aminopeptidase
MFTKTQLERYADVLWEYGLKTSRTKKYKKGDMIKVTFPSIAIDLAEIIHGKLIKDGMNPLMMLNSTPTMEKNFYELGKDHQLEFVVPWAKKRAQTIHGSIYIHGPMDLFHLKNAPKENMVKTAKATKFLTDIMFKRTALGDFGWTLALYPTQAMADEANMTLKEYTNQVIRACYLNRKDAVNIWKDINRQLQRQKKKFDRLLKSIEYFHIESKNVDLKITPGERRQWMSGNGYNVPSFELFTSPDWRGTEGTYYADQPAFVQGNLVQGITLKFEKGKVVESHAEKGDKTLQARLKTDGGAKQIGEFSLTDKRMSKINKFMANTLFDENFGGRQGNCHIAVGSCYTECFDGDESKLTKAMKKKLGFNDSALHWDIINTEKKTVTAHLKSGKTKTIYDGGMFV